MYPYNTDVVNVSHSEYPQYVKELYSPLQLDFCCKFTHIYFNSKILWQNNWNLLRNKQEPLIGNYIAKADNKKTLTPSGFREAGPAVLNIIGDMSVPLRGTRSLWFGSGSGTKLHITRRLYCVRGCAELIVFVGAWLRRDAIAS